MPFEPNIVPPDDPPLDERGELQLPDELVRLEAELRSQSQALAEAYPPGQLHHGQPTSVGPHTVNKPTVTSKNPGRFTLAKALGLGLASAAVVIALVLIAISGMFRPLPQQPIAVQAQPAAANHQPPIRPVPAGIGAAVGIPETESPVFLRDLSGPELEGLLDLIDSEDEISI